MARPKNKKSKNSFGGLKLPKDKETQLIKLLEEKQLSLAILNRMLITNWLENPIVTL